MLSTYSPALLLRAHSLLFPLPPNLLAANCSLWPANIAIQLFFAIRSLFLRLFVRSFVRWFVCCSYRRPVTVHLWLAECKMTLASTLSSVYFNFSIENSHCKCLCVCTRSFALLLAICLFVSICTYVCVFVCPCVCMFEYLCMYVCFLANYLRSQLLQSQF